MELVNGKIIINENNMETDCDVICDIVALKLADIGRNDLKVEVAFEDENWNEKTCDTWNTIDINIMRGEELISNIQFATEKHEPTLVNTDYGFQFYYVFDYSSSTCTNPIDLKNVGHTTEPFSKGNLLEDILLRDLYDNILDLSEEA